MPLYDYRCENGHQFEEFAKMAECQSPQPCRECGMMAERIYVAFAERTWILDAGDRASEAFTNT